jgi:hypothetical protein
LVTGAGIGYQAGLGIYDIVTAVNDPTLAAAAAAKAAEAKQHLGNFLMIRLLATVTIYHFIYLYLITLV